MKKTIISIASIIAMASCTKTAPTTTGGNTVDTAHYTVHLKPSILFDGHELRANLISDIIPNNCYIRANVSYDWDSAGVFNNRYTFKNLQVRVEQNIGYSNRNNWAINNAKVDTAWSDNKNIKLIY
jgi:hypothetical protein